MYDVCNDTVIENLFCKGRSFLYL